MIWIDASNEREEESDMQSVSTIGYNLIFPVIISNYFVQWKVILFFFCNSSAIPSLPSLFLLLSSLEQITRVGTDETGIQGKREECLLEEYVAAWRVRVILLTGRGINAWQRNRGWWSDDGHTSIPPRNSSLRYFIWFHLITVEALEEGDRWCRMLTADATVSTKA